MEFQAERRRLRIRVAELQLVAQCVGSKPEAVPKKELGRVTTTGVGHCKQASTVISFMCYVRLSEFQVLQYSSVFHVMLRVKRVTRLHHAKRFHVMLRAKRVSHATSG